MESALYLIPVTLGETPVEYALPLRNIEIIRQLKYFIVENRRSAIRFLRKADTSIAIDALTFFEMNEHTDEKEVGGYLEPLNAGEAIGLLSEAGCPGVADPGSCAVALTHERHFRVIPLVGPSSIILSMMASGFNGQNFAFNGYLPPKLQERAQALRRLEQKLKREHQTQIFIETPYRNKKMLESILSVCAPDTRLCIAAGITCPSELIQSKTIAEWKKSKLPELEKIPAIFLLYR